MTDSLLAQAMLRIVAMEKESIVALTPKNAVDAVPYFPYQQETFPYFTNWWQGPELDYLSEDIVDDIHTITIRLVVDHLTAGIRGERARDLYNYAPAVVQFFRENPYLTSTAFPNPVDFIHPVEFGVTANPGMRVFSNAGISAQQVGTEFTLRLPFLNRIF